jgi:hypothetical protein
MCPLQKMQAFYEICGDFFWSLLLLHLANACRPLAAHFSHKKWAEKSHVR